MPEDVPVRVQLQCAKRELELRRRVSPRLAAMAAIVRTLTRLLAAEADAAAGQPELFGGPAGREEEPA